MDSYDDSLGYVPLVEAQDSRAGLAYGVYEVPVIILYICNMKDTVSPLLNHPSTDRETRAWNSRLENYKYYNIVRKMESID